MIWEGRVIKIEVGCASRVLGEIGGLCGWRMCLEIGRGSGVGGMLGVGGLCTG